MEGTSNFAYSGPFNEMVLLGVLAIRLQGLNKKLMWDAQNMRFTNISSSDVLKIVTSDDFKVIDGHPLFRYRKYAEFNALEAANEYIRHTYREGWEPFRKCRYKYETIYYISTMYGHAHRGRPYSWRRKKRTGRWVYRLGLSHNLTLMETLDKTQQLGMGYAEAFFFSRIGCSVPKETYLNYDLSDDDCALLRHEFKKRGIKPIAFGVASYGTNEEWDKFFAFAHKIGAHIVTVEPELNQLDYIESSPRSTIWR